MRYIKYIPNILSASRIVLSVLLLMMKPLSISFFLVYIVCGLTDIFDGYIARKTNNMSKFGAMMDSIADIIFLGVLLIILIPMISLTRWETIWIIGIAIVRMLSLVVGYVKFHTVSSLHTYSNKATGLILFFFPLIYQLSGSNKTVIIILFVAGFSALEELILIIKSRDLNVDIKGLFF